MSNTLTKQRRMIAARERRINIQTGWVEVASLKKGIAQQFEMGDIVVRLQATITPATYRVRVIRKGSGDVTPATTVRTITRAREVFTDTVGTLSAILGDGNLYS